MTLEKIFSRSVRRGECLIFQGGAHKYGLVHVNGRNTTAHRAAYMLSKGPLTPDIEVCHRCDTPRCVNPDHLFVGSHAENMADMSAKGRATGGRKHLSDEGVAELRRLRKEGLTYKQLAQRFSRSETNVWQILSGRRHRRRLPITPGVVSESRESNRIHVGTYLASRLKRK